jgi:hypothetical protein
MPWCHPSRSSLERAVQTRGQWLASVRIPVDRRRILIVAKVLENTGRARRGRRGRRRGEGMMRERPLETDLNTSGMQLRWRRQRWAGCAPQSRIRCTRPCSDRPEKCRSPPPSSAPSPSLLTTGGGRQRQQSAGLKRRPQRQPRPKPLRSSSVATYPQPQRYAVSCIPPQPS